MHNISKIAKAKVKKVKQVKALNIHMNPVICDNNSIYSSSRPSSPSSPFSPSSSYKSCIQLKEKKYKVILEYFAITIITDNMDWKNKRITINANKEHIMINIQRLENKCIYENPVITTTKPAIEYQDIMLYWDKIKDIYLGNELCNIPCNDDNLIRKSLKHLQLNNDYFITPCYITNDIIILGIVIFPYSQYTTNYKIIESHIYLSTIKPLDARDIHKTHNFNIINGILNYRVNIHGNIKILGNEILNNKFLKIRQSNMQNEMIIKWEYIFRNIANYLPAFNIIEKSKCIE